MLPIRCMTRGVWMLINHEEAGRIDGQSRTSRDRLIQAELYPRPVIITAGRVGFVRSEVEAWVRARIAARDENRDPASDPIILATGGKSGLQRLLRRRRHGGVTGPEGPDDPDEAVASRPGQAAPTACAGPCPRD